MVKTRSKKNISALVVVHNEEKQLHDCLKRLNFADEIVVVLDNCTDGSKRIAKRLSTKQIEGSWELEGLRRNKGISNCSGNWILEVDADERVGKKLASEILEKIHNTTNDWFLIPVDNYIGNRLIKYGWGGSFGKSSYPGLFRKGHKIWGKERVHPKLKFKGKRGQELINPIRHNFDRNISGLIRKLDSYSSARALDLRDSKNLGTFIGNFRRIFSRFLKCYFFRKGYREGSYGLLIALLAALYPILSYLKAKNEKN